ncbi:DUF3596 domain-containing protein [Pseudoalteromonas carrageenovora]|uniref:site-specific integrase n=1 Tax=Pseudoalteromonas carrageenovora TaxID=227 RepID=UPI0026E11B0B|nr:site-specific integrase [Pseudoalteromonas carrageenovora]MDO6637906.1 DUF3596 domain-containing protein [Pseudoalteromonas carrageenovora]MDO6650193.1 DUF3596 domain-containing protein [Pseudoalteromonas carrageenovora]
MLSLEQAILEAKKYPGISIHGKSIRMTFMYLGKRRLETLKNIKLTASNIKNAANKRAAVCHDIETGRFDYIAAFPNSKTALSLLIKQNVESELPLNPFLELYIQHSKVNNRAMTHRNNVYRINNHIRPFFGERCMRTIKVSEIKNWIVRDLSHLSNKTICEVLTPLRAAFKYAFEDELIKKNPLDLVVNPKKETSDHADPFTRKEIELLSSTETKRKLELDALLFAFWTGLRPSELFALATSDVDLENRKVYVRRSVVRGNLASTKNDGSNRCIDLIDNAYEILAKVIDEASTHKTHKVKVLQSNNRLYEESELQFIFTSSVSKTHWSDSDAFNRMFLKPHCELAGVRYRGIGQARHTYGSQLITANINLNWIAKQMGHSSIKMLEKHYGRWMESEIPDMAAQVSKKLKQKLA